MLRHIFSIFSLFVIPAVVLMTPLAAQSDPVNSEEVAHMKYGCSHRQDRPESR
jgi:hypothetical protein